MKIEIEDFELKNIAEVLRLLGNQDKLRIQDTCLGRMFRRAEQAAGKALLQSEENEQKTNIL